MYAVRTCGVTRSIGVLSSEAENSAAIGRVAMATGEHVATAANNAHRAGDVSLDSWERYFGRTK